MPMEMNRGNVSFQVAFAVFLSFKRSGANSKRPSGSSMSKTADWVVDLGPEGGEDGGRVVAIGTPEQVAQSDASYTGRYLRAVLAEGRSHAYAAGR